MSNRVKKSSRNGATEAVGDCYEAAASLMLEVCEHGRRLTFGLYMPRSAVKRTSRASTTVMRSCWTLTRGS